jgi:hypothetical protein
MGCALYTMGRKRKYTPARCCQRNPGDRVPHRRRPLPTSPQDIPSFMGLTAAFGNPHATFDEVVHMTHVGAVQLSSDGKALP